MSVTTSPLSVPGIITAHAIAPNPRTISRIGKSSRISNKNTKLPLKQLPLPSSTSLSNLPPPVGKIAPLSPPANLPWVRIASALGFCALSILSFCCVRHLMHPQPTQLTLLNSNSGTMTCTAAFDGQIMDFQKKNRMADLGDLFLELENSAEALDAYKKGALQGDFISLHKYLVQAERSNIGIRDQELIKKIYFRTVTEKNEYDHFRYSFSKPKEVCSELTTNMIRRIKRDGAFFDLGNLLKENGDDAEALEAYKKAAEKGDKNALTTYLELAKKMKVSPENTAKVYESFNTVIMETYSENFHKSELSQFGYHLLKKEHFFESFAFFEAGLKAGDYTCMAGIRELEKRIEIPHIEIIRNGIYRDALMTTIDLILSENDYISDWIKAGVLSSCLEKLKQIDPKAVVNIPNLNRDLKNIQSRVKD